MESLVTEKCCFCGHPFQVPYWSDRTHCYRIPCLGRASGAALYEAEQKALQAKTTTIPTLRRLAETSARAAEFRAFEARIEYHNKQVTQA